MAKKMVSMLMITIMTCIMFTLSVSAATGYFSGNSGIMNSLNGNPSSKWPISSGSINSNAKVTSVTVNVTKNSGSDSFDLYVEAPNGYTASKSVSSSGTLTFNDFNNINPTGKWYIYIKTKGVVSTATARLTVNYSY